ncbi:MAG TPA: hypothetical protein PK971_08855 [Saprospiraceae bacterium]|nr:hypothetical protein [Saprospiraceae bacterium]
MRRRARRDTAGWGDGLVAERGKAIKTVILSAGKAPFRWDSPAISPEKAVRREKGVLHRFRNRFKTSWRPKKADFSVSLWQFLKR